MFNDKGVQNCESYMSDATKKYVDKSVQPSIISNEEQRMHKID